MRDRVDRLKVRRAVQGIGLSSKEETWLHAEQPGHGSTGCHGVVRVQHGKFMLRS